MDRGYFPVFRRIFDSDIWGHPVARDVWVYILGHVTYHPTKLCANYGCVELSPGQMVTGLHSLAAGCHFSVQQIRTAISYLESTNRITRQATKKHSIITVCNWEAYRAAQFGDQQTEQQSEQPTDNKQITNRQQTDNNIQEVKKLIIKETPKPIAPSREKGNGSATKRSYALSWNLKFDGITPDIMEGWEKAYPAVNIPRELYAMDQWLIANPDKRKKNYYRFITNWLSRKQERAR